MPRAELGLSVSEWGVDFASSIYVFKRTGKKYNLGTAVVTAKGKTLSYLRLFNARNPGVLGLSGDCYNINNRGGAECARPSSREVNRNRQKQIIKVAPARRRLRIVKFLGDPLEKGTAGKGKGRRKNQPMALRFCSANQQPQRPAYAAAPHRAT